MQSEYRTAVFCRTKNAAAALLPALMFLVLIAAAARAANDHTGLITTYEGSKTCQQCHETAVQDVSRTIHYRLMGEVQDVYNMFTNEPEAGPQGKGNRY